MSQNLIEVLKGDLNTKYSLETMSNVYKNNLQVKQAMKILEQLIKVGMNVDWWYALCNDEPIAIILAINRFGHSQLSHHWIDHKERNKRDTMTALLKEWLKEDFKSYIADINPDSRLKFILEKLKFKFKGTLLHLYEVHTFYAHSDLSENYILREAGLDDIELIYDVLIKPNVMIGSPIYLSKDQFFVLAQSDPDRRKNWLLCTDDDDNFLGFAGSPPLMDNISYAPVVYGPYTNNADVEEVIIAEFITHWKMMGKEKINIIRTTPINKDTLKKYQLTELTEHSIIRYAKGKLKF